MKSFFLATYQYFSRHRWALLLILLAYLGITVFLSLKIKMDEDITSAIPHDPKIDKYNEVFNNTKFKDKLVLYLCLNDTGKTLPDQLIPIAEELVDSLNSASFQPYVASITANIASDVIGEVFSFFQQNIPLYLTEKNYDHIDSLLNDIAVKEKLTQNIRSLVSPAGLAMRKFIQSDPLGITGLALQRLNALKFDANYDTYNDYVFSRDHKTLLLFVTPINSSAETSLNTVFIERLNSTIHSITQKKTEGITIGYYGALPSAVSNASQIKKDTNFTMILAIGLIFILLLAYYRRFSVSIVLFIPVIFGALFSYTLMYLFFGKVSAIAFGMGSVLLGISIDYSIFIFTHFRHQPNIKELIKDLTGPILIGSITTAAGFACLLILNSDGLKDLAFYGLSYALSSAFFSLFLLPHFLKNRKTAKEKLIETENMKSINWFNGRWAYLFVLLITLFSAWFIQKVEFESDLNKMNYLSDDLKQYEAHIEKINTGVLKSVYLVSSGKTLNQAFENAELTTTTTDSLLKNNTIRSVSGAPMLMMSQQEQQKRINRWNNFWKDGRKDRAKRLLLEQGKPLRFSETAFKEFFAQLDKDYQPIPLKDFELIRKTFLNDWISEKPDMVTLVTVLKVPKQNIDKTHQAFQNHSNATLLDKEYLMKTFVEIIRNGFSKLFWLSSIVVFLLLILYFGRIELAIICFSPMLIAWFWVFGLMGALNEKFNLFNISIIIFIFGVGIDYSIFILQGLLKEYRTGMQQMKSYRLSVAIAALTTLIGLGVLIFAKHPSLRSIAVLSIVGISSVVILSNVIIPPLFKWLIYIGKKKRTSPVSLFIIIYATICYGWYFITCLLAIFFGIVFMRLMPIKRKYRSLLLHYLIYWGSKSTIYLMYLVKKRFIDLSKVDFSKPLVIICNHQSHIDIPLMLMLHPKIIFLTTGWVWESPLLGPISRLADFYPVHLGLETFTAKIEQKVKDGYSIVIFPEGTRSPDMVIRRFHKGAFYIANKLNIPIQPVVIVGTAHYIPKGEMLGNKSTITLKCLDPIAPSHNYQQITRDANQLFRKEFAEMNLDYQYPAYYRSKLLANYAYKGSVIEKYLSVKIHLEKDYELFNQLIPLKASIMDIGCGYGFMTYILSYLSKDRNIEGFDYDEEKITIANHCKDKTEQITFYQGDAETYAISPKDVFIISDMLHYIPEDKQLALIRRCWEHLNPEGKIIIRDANVEFSSRHFGTKVSEFFSTRFGFNQAKYNKLFFNSCYSFENLAKELNAHFELFDTTKHNSNVLYVFKKL
ncbi:MAG: 1-acyl-sn-glycerol-3-phosphate acyltransferase [Bacteroidota bacterium]